MVQTLRANFRSLLHRPAFQGVHNLVPANVLQVPLFVLLHVARGSKFVPTAKNTSVKALKAGLNSLRRSMLLCKRFAAFDHDKPLTKCRLKSSWVPPGHPKVDAYMRLLSDELASFEPQESRSNMGWLDRKARAWLKQHEHIAVVDCDKGLGDALVPKSWVHSQVQFQLSQGYVQLDPAEFLVKMRDSKFRADALVQFFLSAGAISFREYQFLRSNMRCSSAGVFRILAKIHKDPIASRPVCNLRGVWFTPFLTFLVEKLGTLTNRLHSVITSTDQLLNELQTLRCAPGMQFVTLDIVNLYPSVCRKHLLQTIQPFLQKNLRNLSLSTFVLKVLELVLDACVVTYGGCHYESQEGIPTGLSAASLIANIYLWHFDCFIEQHCGKQLQFVRRYIDDLLFLWAGDPADLTKLADSWHQALKFQLAGCGTVNFLDVVLSIRADRGVHWSLYRKPKNLFLYVPANSCHPASCFKSLQLGGFLRCNRRNRLAQDKQQSLNFFKLRLKDRGYSLRQFDTLVQKFQCKAKVRSDSKVKKLYIKIPFNRDINQRWLKSCVRKYRGFFQKILPSAQVGFCWRVGANLFRRRYGQTWRS